MNDTPKYKDRKDWMLHEPLKPRTVKYTEMTMEERIVLRKRQMNSLKEGNITKEQYESLIKEYPLPGDV